jgi:hypothetical protein
MNHIRIPARRGFALPLVLILLASVASFAAVSATESLACVASARDARHHLQRRWAITSLDRLLLEKPAATLTSLEQSKPASVGTVQLGDFTCHFCMADEQAKVDINSLYTRLGRAQTAAHLQALQALSPKAVPLELRPEPLGTYALPKQQFASWGQITSRPSSKLLCPIRISADDLAEHQTTLSSVATLWTDGKLNFRTAPRAILKLALGEHAGLVDRLFKLRETSPGASLNGLLEALDLTETQTEALTARLCDESITFSLTLRLETPTTRYDHLHIQTRATDGFRLDWTFSE